MVSVEIPGNIEIQIEKHEPLFELIYLNGSDKIAAMLKDVLIKLQGKKANKEMVMDDNLCLLYNLSESFKHMNETPIVLFIKE